MRARHALFVAVLLATSLATKADAHLGHYVVSAERYIKLDLSPDEARIVVSLSLGASAAERLLTPADRDRDGNVSQSEAETYLSAWARGLATELPIELDGQLSHARYGEGVLAPLGVIHPEALTVEMVARIPLGPGEHTIRIQDRMDLSRFERTDIAFRTRDGIALVASDLGPNPDAVHTDLYYASNWDPRGGRFITARVRVPYGKFPAMVLATMLFFALTTYLVLRKKKQNPIPPH